METKMLQQAIEDRDMKRALQIFNRLKPKIASMSLQDPNAAILTDCAARLLERDLSIVPFAKALISKWEPQYRRVHNALDAAHLDIAEGVVALQVKENVSDAKSHIDFAMGLADRIDDGELISFSRYLFTKCLVSDGKYQDALAVIGTGKRFALQRGHPRIVVLFEILGATVLFYQGRLAELKKALKRVEPKIRPQQDAIEAAEVLFLGARMARQEEEYDLALEKFDLALRACEGAEGGATHPLSLQCYAYKAHTAMILAKRLEEQRKPDRKYDLKAAAEKVAMWRNDADHCLNKAEHICKALPSMQLRGVARVHWVRAEWYLHMGQLEDARKEAKKAYEIATKSNDRHIMIHALITEGKATEVPSLRDAKAALALAQETENRRLIITARIWIATTLLRYVPKNVTAAQHYFDEAQKIVLDSDRDYLRWELSDLEEEIKGTRAEEEKICDVTNLTVQESGLEKTLQLVEEEIISKWFHAYNQNINQIAAALGTTRSRVRRVLKRKGFLPRRALNPG